MFERVQKILWLAVAILIIGFVSTRIASGITWKVDGVADVLTQLQYLGVLAVLIERSVEVFLNATGRNGALRTDMPKLEGQIKVAAEQSKERANAYATKAGFAIGVILALAGFRLLETMATPGDHFFTSVAFRGADIFLTAGLLAGGAALFHEIPEAIRGVLTPLSKMGKSDGK
ncbi:hypothetical protein [Roseobacter sp.]|uniref:hypothetical protein n=1 Tax=Roseobacter sp. TaxID=1907202 RepID=UPI00385DF54F